MTTKKIKKPCREDMEEEIKSLAMTVKFLMDDVEYLLGEPAAERKELIRNYIWELKDFLKGQSNG